MARGSPAHAKMNKVMKYKQKIILTNNLTRLGSPVFCVSQVDIRGMIKKFKPSVKNFSVTKLVLMLAIVFAGFFAAASTSQAAGPCAASNIRWSSSSNRVYVSGDVECTLTEIKSLGSQAIPLVLVDSTDKIWFLGANLFLENGAKVTMHSSAIGGDVNELRLKSNNSSASNSFVEIRADWGTLDIDGVKITSWDEAVSGPDTEYSTYKRAFMRVRSRLVSGVPKESRMDIKNSDIGYLGFNGSESYGLVWKVLGSVPVFDTVGVYGDVEKNKIHHNYFGIYTYGAEAMKFIENEIFNNVKYGMDPHDDSDFVLIDKNDVHHNGNHGIICSQRCNDLTITNNKSYYNTGNGIMLHRNVTNSLVENNDLHHNTDAGIAIYDSHRNIVRGNTSNFNSRGFRTSVGSSENIIENNIFSDNTSYGLYFYKGSDVPTSGDGRPKLNIFRNNEVKSNIKEGIKLSQSDSNTFENNDIISNGSYAVYMNDTNSNLFDNNVTLNGVKNYYYARFNSVNTIKNTDNFWSKIGDLQSIMSIIDLNNTIFSNSKSLATNAFPSQSSIELDKTKAGDSIVSFTALNFTAVPESDTVEIKPVSWNTGGDYYKKWTAKNSISSSISVLYTVGSLVPNSSYEVVVNNSTFGTFTSDASGSISFNYTGSFDSAKTFEVKVL